MINAGGKITACRLGILSPARQGPTLSEWRWVVIHPQRVREEAVRGSANSHSARFIGTYVAEKPREGARIIGAHELHLGR